MKLRLSSDSIRIRVRKSDIEALRQTGRIAEHILLPDGESFGFALQTDSSGSAISAFMEREVLTVSLPAAAAGQWMQSEEVGMETSCALPGGTSLLVLVEKDFPCQHQESSNPEDTFHELLPPQS